MTSDSRNSGLDEVNRKNRIGLVIDGSLTEGVEVRLDDSVSVEDIAVGKYIIIEGERYHFLSMITDIKLGLADPGYRLDIPDLSSPFIGKVLRGTCIFGQVHARPMLVLAGSEASLLEGPQPSKTIPAHFSVAREASEGDIERVFGKEDEKHFSVGTPLDMETRVCLDAKRFIERSNGVFGKSGTGKTFLTRLLIIELIQRGSAVNLIFDMHNEYGWEGTSESGHKVKGLQQLFRSRVAVFTLDEEAVMRRGISADFVVRMSYKDIEPEDIELLRETLNITERAMDAVYQLVQFYGKGWLEKVLEKDPDTISDEMKEKLSIPVSILRPLKLSLIQLKRMKFLSTDEQGNYLDYMMDCLQRGLNVVLEFGRYRENLPAYILVSNMITRRLHQRYMERKERAMDDPGLEPVPLIVTIEEAHKFLNRNVADKTIFGTIAREMRKYNVTLLIVDQRPGSIDDEVMSQLGTKFCCLLDSERDIESVLSGITGRSELRAVLARLETKQQALIFGHAVPMPVVVKVKDYGTPESYSHYTKTQESKGGKSLDDLWE